MSIFKNYDVRGVFPETINAEIAQKIGQACVVVLGWKKVIVGYDMRLSSPELRDGLVAGIIAQGGDVVDIGNVSTDMTYYASGIMNLPAIMITASHNPKQYNGMKFCNAGAQAISYERGLKKLEAAVEQEYTKQDEGVVEQKDILDAYLDHLISLVGKDSIKPMTIAVDAGNGMAGLFMPKLAEKLPQLSLIPLFFELDGTFPNHPANPIDPKNIQDLIATVTDQKADVGLAFDGDADRVYLVDDKGEAVTASQTTAMVAKAMLKAHPGSAIVHNVVCSWIVPEIIKTYGGTPVETQVGHSIIKPIMREKDALFGGEHSGHYYFKDLFYADSGLLASLFVLQLMTAEDKPISKVLEEFRTYHAIPETNTEVTDKDTILKKIASTYKNHPQVISYKDFDGIRVDFENWWFNVRPSNTEPLLRLNLEAKSEELRDEKKKEILQLISG